MKIWMLSAIILLIIVQGTHPLKAHSKWIDIPLNNPGAEAGDMTGWTPWGFISPDPVNFQVVYDPGDAYEGNYYFSAVDLDNAIMHRMRQTIDLSSFKSSLLSIEVSGFIHTTFDGQHRTGYDLETDTEYEYIFQTYIEFAFKDADNNYLTGFGMPANGEGWQPVSINTSDQWIAGLLAPFKNRISSVIVGFFFYYRPIDFDTFPKYSEIEEWREWMGDIPIVRFDSLQLKIEIIAFFCNCDGDNDGDVDGLDLIAFSNLYTESTLPDGDLNEDGLMNMDDINIFAGCFGL